MKQSAGVIRDDEAAVPPAGDKIAYCHRGTVLELDQEQLRNRRWLPVPGAVLGHDQIALEIRRDAVLGQEG